MHIKRVTCAVTVLVTHDPVKCTIAPYKGDRNAKVRCKGLRLELRLALPL